jgi:hypothetical protein
MAQMSSARAGIDGMRWAGIDEPNKYIHCTAPELDVPFSVTVRHTAPRLDNTSTSTHGGVANIDFCALTRRFSIVSVFQ